MWKTIHFWKFRWLWWFSYSCWWSWSLKHKKSFLYAAWWYGVHIWSAVVFLLCIWMQGGSCRRHFLWKRYELHNACGYECLCTAKFHSDLLRLEISTLENIWKEDEERTDFHGIIPRIHRHVAPWQNASCNARRKK